jgi:hypothetical protein
MYLVRIKGDTQNVVKLIYNTTILWFQWRLGKSVLRLKSVNINNIDLKFMFVHFNITVLFKFRWA